MDNKKNGIPKLRFPGFTGAWEQRRLGEVVERFDNLRIPVTSSKREKGITPYYGANGIQDYVQGYTHDGEFVLVAEDGANDLQNYPVHYVNGKVWVNNHAHVLQGKNKMVDNLFLVNAIKQIKIETYLVGGSRAKLNADVMMKLPIKVPTFNEQQKIGEYFSKFDTLIALHQRKLEHLQEQKKGLLQKMFPKNGETVPEVRFPGFTDAWEQRKLGEVGKTFTGLSGKTKEDFGHGDAYFVTYMNVYSNPISDLNMVENVEIDTKQQEVKKGDVFFTTSSETPEEVGMSSVWLGDERHIYLNSFCFGFRPTGNMFNPYYLAYLLRSNNIRNKMMILAQGISRYNISKNKVMKLDITIPNIREQQKIGEFFKQLDSLIALHQRKLDHLELMKKGLLQQMFV
ncbi:restriction endonuclease subunit S [Ligilactobacillus salivarius]|uniref:restriction endonuclease subunit S n=1 Tax=Ligilactobacillus salivarius TaxID=1624 RepID=UPI003B0262B5